MTDTSARDAAERDPVTILYTNWRGEVAVRRIVPIDLPSWPALWSGTTEWHPKMQWFLRARDADKGQHRDFALSGIKAWGQEAVDAALAYPARDTSPGHKGDFMQTYTGRRFWPLDPRPEDVCIEDIAHALSLQTRYGGHCLRFYSVAEHSVHLARAASPEAALWLLLHDGSEAYLSDMVRPLKRHMPEYRAVEDRVSGVVYAAFGLDPGAEPIEVKALDNRILMDERAQVMRPTGDEWHYGGATEPLGITLQFWSPEQAEREFLATFAALTGKPAPLAESATLPAQPAATPGASEGLRALIEAVVETEVDVAQEGYEGRSPQDLANAERDRDIARAALEAAIASAPEQPRIGWEMPIQAVSDPNGKRWRLVGSNFEMHPVGTIGVAEAEDLCRMIAWRLYGWRTGASAPEQGVGLPEGWVAVPREPTEEMQAAGWIDKEDVSPKEIYRSMIDVAPAPSHEEA